VPARERLADLIGRGRVNAVEIRLLNPAEVSQVPSLRARSRDELARCYLSRLATDYQPQDLAHQDPRRARSAQLVFETLIRKFDHHEENQWYVNGAPLVFDHDAAFHPAFVRYPIGTFAFSYGWHLAGKTLPLDLQARFRDQIDAVQTLEGYDQEQLQRSLREFQALDFRALAIEAGYTGEALEEVVGFLTTTSRSLPRDVAAVLRSITEADVSGFGLDADGSGLPGGHVGAAKTPDGASEGASFEASSAPPLRSPGKLLDQAIRDLRWGNELKRSP